MEKKTIKLKRHESFPIREGWLEKGINIIKENPSCFLKNHGPSNFGLGTNMVKSLKYWLEACQIVEFNNVASLTEFGELLYEYDRYLDNIFSWWLIHYFLSTNYDLAIVINEFFNMDYNKTEKETFFNYLKEKLSKEYNLGADSSLEGDISVLFRSYYSDGEENPEINLNCPLAKLKLINYQDKKYVKLSPKISELNYLIIFYSLYELAQPDFDRNKTDFNLEDLIKRSNSPLKIFNISLSTLMIYMDEMKSHKLISLIKTAGLNTIKFLKPLNLYDVFKMYYER